VYTVSSSLNVTSEAVTILNVTESILNVPESEGRLRTRRQLTSVVLLVDYSVLVVMQQMGFQDSSDASSFLTNLITSVVESGEFGDRLASVSSSLGVTVFVNTTVSGVTVSEVVVKYLSPAPTYAPTRRPTISMAPTREPTKTAHSSKSDSSSSLSDGGLIGIIIASCVVGIALIGSLVYYFLSKASTQKNEMAFNKNKDLSPPIEGRPSHEQVMISMGEDDHSSAGVVLGSDGPYQRVALGDNHLVIMPGSVDAPNEIHPHPSDVVADIREGDSVTL
jgi:hypothetical protein